MPASKKRIVLFLPSMWDELYKQAKLEAPPEADWELQRITLDVETTGFSGNAYDMAHGFQQAGHLPLLLLPVAHCAENIYDQNLAIVGPAVRTRDDVYVFRSRRKPSSRSLFRIGVKEEELT